MTKKKATKKVRPEMHPNIQDIRNDPNRKIADLNQRAQDCLKEILAILSKYNCRFEASVTVSSEGNKPFVNIVANEIAK